MTPTIGHIVQYRGKQGANALRAAIVTATVDTLDPDNVDAGLVPGLDSNAHVHLHVFTPGERGFFVEFNVPQDEPSLCRPGTWQWPTRQPMTGHRATDERAGAFHAKAGWYFKRAEDGSVTIWAADDGAEITLDPDSWASVVASVSAPGESSASFAAARRLHAGGQP